MKYKSAIFNELFTRFVTLFYCVEIGYLNLEKIKEYADPAPVTDNEHEDAKKFHEKFSFLVYDTFIPQEMWINIFEHKPVNASELIEHILNRVDPEVPNWEKLWRFKMMNDEDITQAYNGVLQDICEQKYLKIYEIIHAFMIQVDMANCGFISDDKAKIVLSAKEYMDAIVDKLAWNKVDTKVDFRWSDSGGYGYHAQNSSEFDEITEYLEKKMLEKCKANRMARYQDLVNDITNEERAYIKICSQEYLQADIFSDSDPQILWDKLINLNPAAFNEITHYLTKEVITHHLVYNKHTEQLDFWKQIITCGEKFLEEHPNCEKAKCLQLREEFLPQLREMVAHCEKQ